MLSAAKPAFYDYQKQVVVNLRLSHNLYRVGYTCERWFRQPSHAHGPRPSHPDLTGKKLKSRWKGHVTLNRITVPGETRAPFKPALN